MLRNYINEHYSKRNLLQFRVQIYMAIDVKIDIKIIKLSLIRLFAAK